MEYTILKTFSARLKISGKKCPKSLYLDVPEKKSHFEITL